jgi:hypothetical protein
MIAPWPFPKLTAWNIELWQIGGDWMGENLEVGINSLKVNWKPEICCICLNIDCEFFIDISSEKLGGSCYNFTENWRCCMNWTNMCLSQLDEWWKWHSRFITIGTVLYFWFHFWYADGSFRVKLLKWWLAEVKEFSNDHGWSCCKECTASSKILRSMHCSRGAVFKLVVIKCVEEAKNCATAKSVCCRAESVVLENRKI